jgi:uncharacterized protein (DUF2147 family)
MIKNPFKGGGMKKVLQLILCVLCLHKGILSGDDITGFWKTIDDKTGQPQSIVAVYPYQGKYFGRLVVTYDEQGHPEDTIYHATARAPGVVGNPFYAGLDIIWDLKPEGDKYVDGEILDPEHGRIYGAEVWRKGDDLIVRGKVLFLGRNQTWPKAVEGDFPPDFQKPDLTTLVPVIPKPQKKS